MSDLKRRGAGVDHIRRTSSASTSGTVIFTVEGEDRRYLHSIGANAEFTANDIDPSLLDGVRVLYVGGYLAMPTFKADQVASLFREAKHRGVVTMLDVVMPAGVALGVEHVAAVLPYTDYFLPNQDEAQRLTGQAGALAQAECLNLINRECTIVITRGPHGALAKRGDRVIETPPFRMKTIDESGAGDAFAAGLIAGLLENWELDRALSFAAAVGASCTRELGCSAGIFTFDEAVTFMAAADTER
jgi:sugar/nucleoside kinase (ribokinase family)